MTRRPSARAPLCLVLVVLVAAVGCSEGEGGITDAQSLELAFLEAEPGDLIYIPAGTYQLNRTLRLEADGVTVRGDGMAETVLSFAGQEFGAEGMLVNADDFTIADLAIEDTKGDALKVNEAKNVVIRNVRTEWTGGPATENGAYGIYPVQTENTLVEGSVAIGASDAGIYVGQSKNVIVRNCRAEYNVAGIEIENTIHADVHDNVAINNTGGILVFNMPDLPQRGYGTRVFDNRVENNNHENFAAAGTAVSTVPAGSGIVINSNDEVEIFRNEIANNQTANVIVTSYYSAGYTKEYELADVFDPYPEAISIHDNRFSGGGDKAGTEELEQLRIAAFGPDGRFPDVLWDGIVNADRGDDAPPVLCVDNAAVIDVDAENQFAEPSVAEDPYRCQLPPLEPVDLGGLGVLES